MAYAKIENGAVVKYPYTVAEIKADFPDVDFSNGFTDEVVAACSILDVKQGEIPAHSSSTHKFITTVEINSDGEAVAVVTAERRRPEEAAYNLRNARDIALAKTDWLATKSLETGQPIPSEYAAYRQALRDLPNQEGFPYDVIWPDQPR